MRPEFGDGLRNSGFRARVPAADGTAAENGKNGRFLRKSFKGCSPEVSYLCIGLGTFPLQAGRTAPPVRMDAARQGYRPYGSGPHMADADPQKTEPIRDTLHKES